MSPRKSAAPTPPASPPPPEPVPVRGPVHERLGVFIGTWKSVGRTGAGAATPDVRMFGEEAYEWLPEGFFLVHRFDRRIGHGTHKGMAVLGYDAYRQQYFADFFDSLGYARRYGVQVQDNMWTLTGTWERATFTFNERNDAIAICWELSSDGATWRPLCELTAVKQVDAVMHAAIERIVRSGEP